MTSSSGAYPTEWLLLLFCNSSDERDRIILMLLRIAKATLDQDPQ